MKNSENCKHKDSFRLPHVAGWYACKKCKSAYQIGSKKKVKKPTLKEVQEYFKDANVVETIYGTKLKNIGAIFEFEESYLCTANLYVYSNFDTCLWEDGIYAKII